MWQLRASALTLALVAGSSVHASAGTIAAVGRPAPAFDVTEPAGSDLTLATYAGRPLVLNVFASWCPPCRQELPRIVSAARRTRGRIAFVGVDAQEPVAMAVAFAKSMRLPYPIAIDHGQFAASYGVTSLPATIFVDRGGTVRAIYRGPISAADLARDLALIAPETSGT